MITLYGVVKDSSHITSDNYTLSVIGLPDWIVGKSGYFLLERRGFYWFFHKAITED
jgi:hypothetical protein